MAEPKRITKNKPLKHDILNSKSKSKSKLKMKMKMKMKLNHNVRLRQENPNPNFRRNSQSLKDIHGEIL